MIQAIIKHVFIAAIFAATFLPNINSFVHASEVHLSDKEYARLDSFEQQILKRADKVFNDAKKKLDEADYLARHRRHLVQEESQKRDEAHRMFARAAAEYESFIVEFDRSSAVPYAILRKARSLHLAERRFNALKIYDQEVLDFFPDDVKFAAAALYYIGLCHWQNGEVGEAMRAWKEMAEDVDYSKEPLAADALNRLADNFEKQNQAERSVAYYMQVAINFRKSNADAARAAMRKVIPYYIRTNPQEPKLREFYQKVDTFHHHPRKAPKEIVKDKDYWNFLRQYIRENGKFNDLQVDLRKRYYRYWADQFQGKFPDWDDFQIDFISYRRQQEGDTARWISRLDKQFKQFEKPDDHGRIVKWIRAYATHKPKVEEYYNKLNFDKVPEPALYDLTRVFVDHVKNYEMAVNVASKVKWEDVGDGRLWNPWVYHLRNYRHDALIEELCRHFEDSAMGRMHLTEYYFHYRGNMAKVLEITKELINEPNYAAKAAYLRGEALRRTSKFEEAIKFFRLADSYSPPSPKFQIAECQRRLGKLKAAVVELQEIENFFKDHAPAARWQIATFYNEAGNQKQYIANLRAVLKLYPKSKQASDAHNALEKLGVQIGGGTDE